jgi:hypothetical protein
MMERRWNVSYTPQKNKLIEDLVGNGHPVPDPKKTMINVTNEPRDVLKKVPQRGNHGRNH